MTLDVKKLLSTLEHLQQTSAQNGDHARSAFFGDLREVFVRSLSTDPEPAAPEPYPAPRINVTPVMLEVLLYFHYKPSSLPLNSYSKLRALDLLEAHGLIEPREGCSSRGDWAFVRNALGELRKLRCAAYQTTEKGRKYVEEILHNCSVNFPLAKP